MKQHKLKVRLLSMLTALTMLTALFYGEVSEPHEKIKTEKKKKQV